MKPIRISIDFDHCLTQPHVSQLANDLLSQGHEVWIVTSRWDNLIRLTYPDLKTNEDLFTLAKEVGVPTHRIGFTNQRPKWISLNAGGFHIHIDDKKEELNALKYYDIVKGFDCNADNFHEAVYDYLQQIKNF